MAVITINGNSLDTSSRRMLASATDRIEPAVNASKTSYIIIRSKEALTDNEKEDLKHSQVDIRRYVDTNTYLCNYKSDDLEYLRQQKAYLDHIDIYHNVFKIHADLKEQIPNQSEEALPEGATGAPTAGAPPEDDPIPIVIGLHEEPTPTAEEIVQELVSKGLIKRENTTIHKGRIDTVISPKDVWALEKYDSVRSVEEDVVDEEEGNIARTVLNCPVTIRAANPAPTVDVPVRCEGTGQVIHVVDSGFDADLVNNVHPCFPPVGGQNRLLGHLNPRLPFNPPATISDTSGHGTHVTGCALGDATSTTMGGVTAATPGPIQGTAPAAQFVVTRRKDAVGKQWDGDVDAILDVPYAAPFNARISNHSYGPNMETRTTQYAYGTKNTEYDDYIFGKSDLLVCWSGGNWGRDRLPALTAQVSGRSCCKNTLAVGATLNARKMVGGRFSPDPLGALSEESIRAVADFSSRGPTKEFRRKPDVCAPGSVVLSALSRTYAYPSGTNPPPNTKGTSTDTNLYFNSGTSMAAPLVAGCAAVLREALNHRGVRTPSAALLKVLLIHGAVDMYRDIAPAIQANPENLQGFGRVNMGSTIHCVNADAEQDPSKKMGGFVDAPDTIKQAPALAQGHAYTLELNATAAAQPRRLKVTLTWMDRGGSLLVNALGLAVTLKSGERRHGNMGVNDRSGTPKVYDDKNNVQQVVWESIPVSNVYVTVECVRAFNTAEHVKYALAWSLE